MVSRVLKYYGPGNEPILEASGAAAVPSVVNLSLELPTGDEKLGG